MSDYNLFDYLKTPISKPRKRLFISFEYESDNRYFNLLHAWSKNKDFDLEFYSESVREAFDSQNSEYIRSQIRPRIQRASITICLVSHKTGGSSWVNWEVEHSIKEGNNLIAVNTTNDIVYLPPAFTNQIYVPINSFNYEEIKAAIDNV